MFENAVKTGYEMKAIIFELIGELDLLKLITQIYLSILDALFIKKKKNF